MYLMNRDGFFYAKKDRVASGVVYLSAIEAMNYVIHLQKLANLKNKKSVLKLKGLEI